MAIAYEERVRTNWRSRIPRRARPHAPSGRLLSRKESRHYYDELARKELGISGKEFLRRWDAGEYRFDEETDLAMKVNRLVMAMPWGR